MMWHAIHFFRVIWIRCKNYSATVLSLISFIVCTHLRYCLQFYVQFEGSISFVVFVRHSPSIFIAFWPRGKELLNTIGPVPLLTLWQHHYSLYFIQTDWRYTALATRETNCQRNVILISFTNVLFLSLSPLCSTPTFAFTSSYMMVSFFHLEGSHETSNGARI